MNDFNHLSGLDTALNRLKEVTASFAQNQFTQSMNTSFDALEMLRERFLDVVPQPAHIDYAISSSLQILQDSLNDFAQQSAFLPFSALDGLRDVQKSIANMTSIIAQTGLNNCLISNELADSISSALTNSCQFLDTEQQEERDEIMFVQQEISSAKFLSIENIFHLIEILLMALTLVLSQMPDPQQEKIVEQNSHVISIEEDRLDLERQRTEKLEEIAEALMYTINGLAEQVQTQSDEIDDLRELVDDMDDPDVPESQDGESDTQAQNTDT